MASDNRIHRKIEKIAQKELDNILNIFSSDYDLLIKSDQGKLVFCEKIEQKYDYCAQKWKLFILKYNRKFGSKISTKMINDYIDGLIGEHSIEVWCEYAHGILVDRFGYEDYLKEDLLTYFGKLTAENAAIQIAAKH